MKNPGQEIIPYSAYLQELVEEVPRMIDLTLVYNQHVNSEDAMETTSIIESDSTVFIEGFSTKEGGQAWYKADLEYLARLRVLEGKSSPQYIELRNAIIQHIEQQLTTMQAEAGDFSYHTLLSIKLLLQKDCIVQYADFFDLESDRSDIVETTENFRAIQGNRNRDEVSYFGDELNIAKSIVDMHRNIKKEYQMHYIRESYARATVTAFFSGFLREHRYTNDLRKSELGKIKTYITYGTAHQKSLSNEFATRGFIFKRTILDEMSDSDMIAESPYDFMDNINRQMAYKALRSISWNLVAQKQFTDEQAKIYSNLELVNKDPQELMKFMIRCHQIGQQFQGNDDRWLGWLIGLRTEVLEDSGI